VTLVRRVVHVMGMPISLAVRGDWNDDLQIAWEAAIADLQEVDRLFSTYRSDSWVSRRNRGEVNDADAPADMLEVYALGERWRVSSRGAFDIWSTGILDPSGVVKGWAVQRAARRFEPLGVDFCLNAGGDMVCHATVEPWMIGIEDPSQPDRIIATVPVTRGGVATSGAARRGAHITDRRTGRVAAGLASVTVIADTLVRADLDATAAYALGADGVEWLRGRAGATAVLVHDDGRSEVIVGGQLSRRALAILGSSQSALVPPRDPHPSSSSMKTLFGSVR
jgi:thiamine biosynthesis lipoprotein